jgi:hypothetical protein
VEVIDKKNSMAYSGRIIQSGEGGDKQAWDNCGMMFQMRARARAGSRRAAGTQRQRPGVATLASHNGWNAGMDPARWTMRRNSSMLLRMHAQILIDNIRKRQAVKRPIRRNSMGQADKLNQCLCSSRRAGFRWPLEAGG